MKGPVFIHMRKKLFGILILIVLTAAIPAAAVYATGTIFAAVIDVGPYTQQATDDGGARAPSLNPIAGFFRQPLTRAQSCEVSTHALRDISGGISVGDDGDGSQGTPGSASVRDISGGATAQGAPGGAAAFSVCPACGEEHAHIPGRLTTIEQSLRGVIDKFVSITAPEPRIAIDDPQVKGKNIPILMYHAVADVPWTSNNNLFVRPSELEAQIKYIADNGYQSITFEDLVNIGAFSKPIMLTFDDGYLDNYEILFPLLKKYNVKATVFMIGNAVWDHRYCSIENLQEMANSGFVSVQSHTMGHLNLTTLGKDTLDYELAASKEYLEEITGKPVIALCYPFGANNAAVRSATADYYRYAVTISSGKYICGNNAYSMPRVFVGRGLSTGSFSASIR